MVVLIVPVTDSEELSDKERRDLKMKFGKTRNKNLSGEELERYQEITEVYQLIRDLGVKRDEELKEITR